MLAYQEHRVTEGNQGWMVSLEKTVQTDSQDLREYKALWVFQGNLACLVLKERLVPLVPRVSLGCEEIKALLACLGSQVSQGTRVFRVRMGPLENQALKVRVVTLDCLEIQDSQVDLDQKARMDSLDCLAPEDSPASQVPKAPQGTWALKEFRELKEI